MESARTGTVRRFNWRLRNKSCPESKMSIVDVDRKDKRTEIAAAVNCMQCIQLMIKCFHEGKSRDAKWFLQRPYGETMTGLFRNLKNCG